MGQNFRFGHKAAGDGRSRCAAEGRRFGFAVEGDRRWPDAVRRRRGDPLLHVHPVLRRRRGLASAAQALGRPHRVDGIVVRGDRRGRELGYPTANVETRRTPRSRPTGSTRALGRAAQGASRSGCPAAISVGTNPTFEGSQRTVEAYILDFDGDIYGEHVGVEFVERLRAMVTFAGVQALLGGRWATTSTRHPRDSCERRSLRRWYPVRHDDRDAV